jgi:V/A-type H+-transporting ATPase subunit D
MRATRKIRHPPGRAGRLWLEGRLTAATRGADVLQRKLTILRREHEHFSALADSSRAEWEAACFEAERWGLLVAVLGGEHAMVPPDTSARVDVTWASLMGVRYPSGAACLLPPEDARPVDATAALPVARSAYRRALEAGVACAAASAAAGVAADEIATTRTKLRAIENHWRPRLEHALSELEASLAEEEAADGIRLRLSAHSAENQ